MRDTLRVRGLISASMVFFLLSACLIGCGSKGKKEEAPPSSTSPSPENIKIPEPPGAPIIETVPGQPEGPVMQGQPVQGTPYQQPSGGNVVVNNYPPSSGATSSVFGAIPWWALWGGSTLAPSFGNPPPGAPPVESTGGIIVYNVGFIPDGSNQYAAQTDVGQHGILYGFFANKYDTAKDLRGVLSVDNSVQKDETVLVPAFSTRGFTQPYVFPTIGRHKLWFTIDGLSDADRTRNVATYDIMVVPVPVGPGGGQAAVNQKDVVAVSVGFKPDGSDGWAQSAKVGQQGVLQGYIDNNFPVGINVAVKLGYFDTLVRGDTVYIEPHARYLFEKPFSFPRAENYMLIISVNQDNAVHEEGPGVADNNMASLPFVVTNADNLPDLTWKVWNRFVDTDDSGHQTIIRESPVHVKVDQRFRMTDDVVNCGGAPSGPCTVVARPTSMAHVESLDNTECPVRALDPGQAQSASSGWFCFTKPGDYTIKLVVNEAGAAQESNADNNAEEFHFVADPLPPEDVNKPNLKAIEVTFYTPVGGRVINETITGQNVLITGDIKNTGPVPVPGGVVVMEDKADGSNLTTQTLEGVLDPDNSIRISAEKIFTTAGPHEIWLKIDPDGTSIPNERNKTPGDNCAWKTIIVGLGQTQGRGPQRLAASAKPDAIATDIGFIPNGERDYADVVTAGKKGTIYAVYDNTAAQDIRNLRVQVLVDGRIIRDSVKTYLRKGERGTISVSNFWFNEGRHKMNLILDPNNELPESNKQNNNVGHYIDAVPRQQPRNYSTPTGFPGLFNPSVHTGTNDGGGTPTPPTYTPPTTPTFTTYGGDQGSSSSTTSTGTFTKKKTPKLTVKGLGK